MHLMFATVGNKFDVDRFILELQGKYYPYTFYNTDAEGKFIPNSTQQYMVQGIVRELRVFEYVFPEQHKDVVLNTILGEGKGKALLHDNMQKKYDKYLWGIRKMAGYNKIPDYDTTKGVMPIFRTNMHVIGLGVKEDRMQDGKEML